MDDETRPFEKLNNKLIMLNNTLLRKIFSYQLY